MNTRQLRTFLVVGFVTVLVWIYAENESRRIVEVSCILRLQSDTSAARVAWFAPDTSLTTDVTVRFDGTASGVEAMRTLLSSELALLIGPDIPSEQGEHTINLLDVLRRHRNLSQRNVVVEHVSPLTIVVRVDELQRRQLQVVPVLPDGLIVGDTRSADPAFAAVVAPKSFTGPLEITSVITARVPSSQIVQTPGIQRVANVPLAPPDFLAGRLHVSVDPPTATVSLRILEQTDDTTLASVPVYIRAPQIIFDEWLIKIDGQDFLTNVKVTGPAEVISRIEGGQTPVFAYITVLPDDALAGSVTKSAVFSDFPGSMRFEADNVEVKLEFTRRAPSQPPENGGEPAAGAGDQ